MAQGTLAPAPWFTAIDPNGVPYAGAKLFTYDSGTSTKRATYTDAGLTVAHPNPIILDSAGRAVIYLSPTAYKFVLAPSTDSDPPIAPIKTVDPVGAVPISADELDVQGIAGEALSAGDGVYLSDGSGGKIAGRWYKWDADFTYASTASNALGMMPAALASGVSGAIRIVGRVTGLTALSPGVLYYISATAGALTAVAPANSRAVAVADSSTSVVLSQFIPIPLASATVSGIVSANGVAQTLGGAYTFNLGPAFSAAPTGINQFLFARCTSNLTKNNNTTFADATGLAFAVGANETWVATYTLFFVSAVTPDIKFTLTGPAAPTAVTFGLVANGDITGRSTAFASPVAVSTNGTDSTSHLSMILRNGANAGTVQLQMAQNSADASNTILYADSFVQAQRVA